MALSHSENQMKVTFLGTAAANAYPEAFCRCDHCVRACALGGPSLRKRSAVLVNDNLLIDLGPDIMTAAFMHDRPLTRVRYCLQTHAHADHLDPSHLLSRSPGYGVIGAPRLNFYGSAGTIREVAERLAPDLAPAGLLDPVVGERLNLTVHHVEALQPFEAGPYRVVPFTANHDPAVEPLLYAVTGQRRTLFYGVDTASLSEETWQGFHRYGLRFDLVILDHTYGPAEPESDHLNAAGVVEHIRRLRDEGLLAAGARAVATHIAHEGNPPHPVLARWAAERGYEVAYDGLSVECVGFPGAASIDFAAPSGVVQ
jgi:phosphoribosyl 1,2-cyclic phosphate phosphodiesterase